MLKKKITADELVWLFHQKFADTDFPNAAIAIIPNGAGGWSTITSAKDRKRWPKFESIVERIEKQLQKQYRVEES